MTNTDKQSRLGSGVDETIPTQSELEDVLEEQVTSGTYQQYFKPYLEFLGNLSSDKTVTENEVYNQLDVDVKEDTKKKYLKKVFEYQPEFCELVVDQNPSAEAFLKRALERANIEIEPENINQAKEACEALSDDLYDSYLNYHIDRIENKMEDQLEEPIPDKGKIPVSRHREVIREFGKVIATDLPEELKSFNQSITKIGGEANEKITIRALKSVGMEPGIHFENISSNSGSEDDPGDLRVFTDSSGAEPINIEIKSSSNRERGGAGLSRLEDPSILFGYFDDQSELAGNLEELIEESIAVYAQPATLATMSTDNSDAHQKTTGSDIIDGDWLFFRSNVVFAKDMLNYYQNGELPEREVGHEEESL